MSEPLNRFSIKDRENNYAKFGALIRKWVKGLESGQLKLKDLPQSIDDFKAEMIKEDIHVNWPTGDNELVELNIFVGKNNRLDIRLPAYTHIKESEDFLNNPQNSYFLPNFYQEVFGAEDAPDTRRFRDDQAGVTGNIAFHNARIGDYTVANCV